MYPRATRLKADGTAPVHLRVAFNPLAAAEGLIGLAAFNFRRG